MLADDLSRYLPFWHVARTSSKGFTMNVRRDAVVGRARSWRVLGLAALVVTVPAVVVAAPSSGARPGAAGPAVAHGAAHSFAEVPAALRPGAVQPAAVTSATDLALELQKLLGQHAVLAAELMRSRMRNDPDLAQSANAAVGKNTRDMAAVVAGPRGPPAPPGVSPPWAPHHPPQLEHAPRPPAPHPPARRP